MPPPPFARRPARASFAPTGGTDRRHHRNAALLLAFCALLWSSAGVTTRHLQLTEGFEVTFWRSFFCVIGVVLALAWRTGGRPLAPVIAMGLPGLVSGVMWAVMFTCFMLALTRTSVANTLVTLSVSPLLTALLAWVVLGERMRAGTWVAVVMAGLGIGWLGGPGGAAAHADAVEAPGPVIDTTGAGDAFVAALLSARREGHDPAAALARACALAATVVTRAGARPGP